MVTIAPPINVEPMNTKLKKRLRAIGHQLKPVVTIAGNGLSESVVAELERALDDHELIKVKIVAEREDRHEVITAIGELDETEIVQVIGGVVLVYRSSREPNPALSNIQRANLL